MARPNRLFLIAAGVALLATSACTVTPSSGTKVASRKKCEPAIGSLVCSNDDQGTQGNLNDPSLNSLQPLSSGGGKR